MVQSFKEPGQRSQEHVHRYSGSSGVMYWPCTEGLQGQNPVHSQSQGSETRYVLGVHQGSGSGSQ
jgi:hypothetical protein